MTTNIDRAAEVIQKKLGCMTLSAEDTAQRLADAGLLAPDLPEPDSGGEWSPSAVSIGSVSVSPAGEVVLHPGNFRDIQLHLSVSKARDLANVLNAAANHAEKEINHE